jgi:hypothetical protein
MTPSSFPELSLHTSESELLTPRLEMTVEIQQFLFDNCGVLAPVIQHTVDKGLVADIAELRLNGELIETLKGGEPTYNLVIALREHAADLLTPKLLEHYLAVLESKYPVLIATVRERIPLDTLATELRDRLTNGGTILDLAGILEELLANDPAVSV